VSRGMQGQGADAATSGQMALTLLDGELLRQAGMMAYNHMFLLVTVLFVLSFPLIFLLKANKKQEGMGEVLAE